MLLALVSAAAIVRLLGIVRTYVLQSNIYINNVEIKLLFFFVLSNNVYEGWGTT